jgi:hypothetical protein
MAASSRPSDFRAGDVLVIDAPDRRDHDHIPPAASPAAPEHLVDRVKALTATPALLVMPLTNRGRVYHESPPGKVWAAGSGYR